MADNTINHGRIDTTDGGVYVGELNQKGQPHGYGILILPQHTRADTTDYDAVYIGEFRNGLAQGYGTEAYQWGVKMARWHRGKAGDLDNGPPFCVSHAEL